MSSLKKISIGAASYDIIPEAITDSNANYKASCPTISSNTTIEVASNKTIVINSSSTDTQYPSAKAVFTAIQNASREGSFASNILTSTNTAYVPLVSSGGMLSTAYLQKLSIPENKTISSIYASPSSTISDLSMRGEITQFNLNGGTIGAAGSTTTGLYGAGTIYTRATGASLVSDAAASQFAIGEIINRGGSTEIGGYITKITNSGRAYIGTLNNTGTIKRLETSGYIEKFIQKSGEILDPEIGEANSIYTPAFGTATNPCLNSGSVYIAHNSSHLGSVTVRSKTSSLGWNVISSGVAKPFIEVSTASDLSSKLNANNLNLLFKYTGETTTYNGVTFTQNNIYTYTAT